MIFFKKDNNLKNFQYEKFLKIENKIFKIKILFSKKNSSNVIVRENIITFRFPDNISLKNLEKNYNDLLEKIKIKILKNIDKFSNESQEDILKKFIEKGSFNFNNQIFFIEFSNKKKFFYDKEKKTFYFHHTKNIKFIQLAIIKTFEIIFLDKITNLVNDLNKKTTNSFVKKVVLKNLKSKWGHCKNFDNEILINLKLLNGNFDDLVYVIIHELCHTIHKNHSNDFWLEVLKYKKDFKINEKNLKLNPPKIFNL